MPIFRLGEALTFPPPELAEDSGVLAVGGDLCPERLLLAYRLGIFPWYGEDLPILWHSPDPRMVLTADRLHVSRRLRKTLRQTALEVSLDQDFEGVIRGCAAVPREGQDGTWITEEMLQAYLTLARLGYAHSCEAWQGDALVGGVYGVSLGAAFFGESMFSLAADASKIAFVRLCEQLQRWQIPLVDCQVHTDHLQRFGAVEWARSRFLEALAVALERPTRRGRWRFDAGFAGARALDEAPGEVLFEDVRSGFDPGGQSR